jgi:hypothetical protein
MLFVRPGSAATLNLLQYSKHVLFAAKLVRMMLTWLGINTNNVGASPNHSEPSTVGTTLFSIYITYTSRMPNILQYVLVAKLDYWPLRVTISVAKILQ